MDKKNETSARTLKISEEVIESVVKYAALGVEGVAGLYKKKRNSDKGAVETDLFTEFPEVTVNITVNGSAKVKSVCENVQKRIHGDVLSMTGIALGAVNVKVCAAVFLSI